MASKKNRKNNPKIAQATLCKNGVCAVRDLLVRGDQVSFVSSEQVERTGIHLLDDQKMPSDIVLPKNLVCVQDTSGRFLDRCSFHIVEWSDSLIDGTKPATSVLRTATDYAGENEPLEQGSVEVPKKGWQLVGEIAFIRYRRAGELAGNYEHPYNPHVPLYQHSELLAWRLALPTGCVVDGRGFVWP